ncbi:TPA: DUF1120 domain-containing protein [Escherichia coli]|nr:DUF1120 domain-containing protein [Escherichia coli]
MNVAKKTICALAVIASISTAVRAENVDVKVVGTITPTACKPVLAGGGTADYGTIPPQSLSKDTYTVLPLKAIDFSITCDAPAKVAVHAVGSKADTSTDYSMTVSSGMYPFKGLLWGVKSINVDGLGKTDDGRNIGGYGIRLDPDSISVDGKTATLIRRGKPGEAWELATDKGSFYSTYNAASYSLSWGNGTDMEPIAAKTVAGKLDVQAYITETSALDLTKPIKLNGLSTLELVYL